MDVSKLVLGFLGYSCTSGELATHYTCSSIILYDEDYRESQVTLCSRWGHKSKRREVLVQSIRERRLRQIQSPFSVKKVLSKVTTVILP